MIKPLSRTGTWKTYSTDHGLPSLRIEHIAEDSKGYIWFATRDNGASRFDGEAFQHFTTQNGLTHDQIFFIQKDRQERLWFGTLKGVCWYDNAGFHPLADDGIAGRPVQFIYEDRQGRIWFGGRGTLGYYDGTVFHDLIPRYLQQYQPPPSPEWNNSCRGIVQDPQGHLWFGFDRLIRFDGESFHRYEEDEGFPRAAHSYVVGQDPTGKVWIGRNRTLWYYADGTFQSVQVDLGGYLRNIQFDREGRMWLCTTNGAFYQDGDGFSRFTPADGLPHIAIKAVFHDREHQFWFATRNGVGLYDAHSINVFDLRADLARNVSEVSQIAQDRHGDIWIGYVSTRLNPNIKSIVRFDGEHFTFIDPEKGSDIENCFSIYEDLEGDLWFGGGHGLFRYEGQTLKKKKITADSDAGGISRITQDRQGRFIFGYWEHYTISQRKKMLASPLKIVYQQDGQSQTVFTEDDKKTSLNRIGTVIATRNDAIYFHLTSSDFPTSDTGFARWHPEEGLTWYGVGEGLIDNHVNDLLLDRHGNLWIATLGGISCFDGRSFRTFTIKDGLPSNRIHCLFEDARGHLWFGTDRGVVHYDGRLFQTIKSPHIGPVCRIFEDRDGTFWLGTTVGSIIRYRPQQNPPLIRLIRVITDQVYQKTDVCRSTVGQPVIFEYKDLSFSTHPRDMLYVYRLQGYDADWCPATRELRACYQNLPPGDYTFQVRAIDQDLNYSEPAQAQLAVKPDAHIETISATLRGDNKVVGPSKVLRQFQTKLTEVAPTDLTVLIGQSDPIRQFQTKLTEVAPSDLAVLILGETGVGKGLAARALHALSAYGKGPFIHVDCGALSQELGDSALFGREDETATSQAGKVEQAKDGTLFLDEIGEMTLETQDKVLRLLEERTFERVGSNQPQAAQTRIVAATSRNLKAMVQDGDFREKLYLRLQMFPLYIPPLREHREDIPALVEFCKNRMAAHLGRQPASLSSEVMEMLHAYDWPGNVRELEHLIQQAVTTCKGSQIEVADLMQHGFNIVNAVLGLKGESQEREIMPLLELERSYILEVLNATNGQIKGTKGAAALLGVPPSTLYHKMRKLGIKRS